MCSLAARTLSLGLLLMPVPALWGQGAQVTHSPLERGVGQGEQSPWSPSQGWVCPPGKSACQIPGSWCRAWDMEENGNPSCSGAFPYPKLPATALLRISSAGESRSSSPSPSGPAGSAAAQTLRTRNSSLCSHPLGVQGLPCLVGVGSDVIPGKRSFPRG